MFAISIITEVENFFYGELFFTGCLKEKERSFLSFNILIIFFFFLQLNEEFLDLCGGCL